MQPCSRRLNGISQFARHDVAFEVARAVKHIACRLQQCVWCSIIRYNTLTFLPLLQASLSEVVIYKEQAWKLKRHIGTILIRVELGTCAISSMSRLPFVRSIKINRQFLTSTKGVTFGKTKCHTRTNTPRCLSYKVALKVYIIRFVKHTVERNVKHIA